MQLTLLGAHPGWLHPHADEAGGQVSRAVKEERKGSVCLEKTEMRLMERVPERSEAREDRSQPRYAASQAKTKTAGVAEVKKGTTEPARTEEWVESEPAMAKAKTGTEAVRDEAVETTRSKKWVKRKSSMTETKVTARTAKSEVLTSALREDVG